MASSDDKALQNLLDGLWNDYVKITPRAPQIHALLEARGEQIRNDHVALRTFGLEPLELERLAEPFLVLGYTFLDEYRFEAKGLRARAYLAPTDAYPTIFISELMLEQFSSGLREIVGALTAGLDPAITGPDLLEHLPTWDPIALETYETLLEESEYAAWVAAFGVRVNHFTVRFNDLQSFQELKELNEFLHQRGFRLNGAPDHMIQGGPTSLLEQSSTLADPVACAFAGDVVHEIPGGYVEFARRYPDPSTGELFRGFVPTSADKLFESTNRAQAASER